MNLLRLILFFFAVYFIRRVYQFYKLVKYQNQQLQELAKAKAQESSPTTTSQSIDAEFKVID